MKDDVEIPAVVPKKRRQLEAALDKWIAVWLSRDDLTPSERRRLEDEKQRRKKLKPNVAVGILVGEEGVTPAQRVWLDEFLLARDAPDSLHWGEWAPPHLRKVVRRLSPATVAHPTHRDVVRNATIVIAMPKEADQPARAEGVWDGLAYARHRKIPAHVVLPNGEEKT